MGAAVAGHFSCASCGKSYRWKPELAGRKAKCKCGAVLVCPQNEPGKVEDELFDLAPDPTPPKPKLRATVAQAAVISEAGSAVGSTAKPALAYQSRAAAKQEMFGDKTMDLYAPVFLIAGAVAVEAVAAMLNRGSTSFAAAMVSVCVDMVVTSIFILIGLLIAAKIRQIKLGPLPSAILKLFAIASAPSAVMDLLRIPFRFIPILGWLLVWVGGFMLYFALIGVFFDLDQEDTWYCVMVILLVKIVAFILLVAGVVAMVMHH
jgi:hypothetical protein